MASRLNPYLTFDGTCREAMEFYQSVLGGTLDVSTFGEFGGAEAGTPEFDKIMHARLETPDGYVIMASDTVEGMPPVSTGTAVTVSISGNDKVLRSYFAGLSEDGHVTVPLERQMWGDEFGQFVDRFGIPWMVDIGTEAGPGATS